MRANSGSKLKQASVKSLGFLGVLGVSWRSWREIIQSHLAQSRPTKIYLPCIFKDIAAFYDNLFDTLCYCQVEKGAFTPKAPRWKVDGRQSSSVSVLLPTVARRGSSEAGIDSVAEFCGL